MIALYNSPGLVCLLIQLATDTWFELHYRRSTVWALRVCVTLSMCIALAATLPWVTESKNPPVLYAYTAIVGVVV
jgi:hypothetical protein